MKKINLGIMFREKTFATRFAESLAGYFNIWLLDSRNDDIRNSIDILLTDIVEIESDIYLVWDRADEDDTHIYAFSGIDGLRRKITYAYGKLNNDVRSLVSAADAKVISVCSAYGGSGVSMIAQSLAGGLGGKTVYLSLADIPCGESGSAPVDINRFMYELNDDYSGADIDAVTYSDTSGIDHIRYREPFNLLNMIDTEELKMLFTKLSSYYDNIVCDLGTRVSPASLEILKLSSMVYCIDIEGRDEERKRRFEEFLDSSGCEIKYIVNFCDIAYSEEGDLLSEDPYRIRRISGGRREVIEYIESKCSDILKAKTRA